MPVAKPNWGQKRICQACGKRFYDLRRTPIVCPSCQAAYDPEAVSKARRARPPAGPAKKAPPPAAAIEEAKEAQRGSDEVPEEAEEIGDFENEEAPGDEEELIEDPSELGGDDDVAKVIDYVDDDEDKVKP